MYLGTGVHLARSGSLAIDDELLRGLPPLLREQLFPSYAASGGAESPHQRSPAGLAFSGSSPSSVYSTFSQLPSVWLAIGYSLGGARGARATTPLLAAAALMAFYLFVRRTAGAAVAALATGLLAPSAPQVLFARFSTGEIGAQFFLWSAFLALSRWYESGSRSAAVAAGLGLGLAALARPEHIVFIPLAAAFLWLVRSRSSARLPLLAAGIATALIGHALLLILFLVPTHYQPTIADTLRLGAAGLARTVSAHPWAASGAAAVLLGAALVAAWRGWRAGPSTMPGLAGRGLVAAGVTLWALLYGYLADSPPGTGLSWLPLYTYWPVLVLAAAGLPLLARRWWRDPAAQLALAICAIAAAHFLYDPRTVPIPFWGARRFLAAALPLLFTSTAIAVAALARLGRPVALGTAALVLATNLLPSRPLWKRPYFRGTGEAAASIAALLPPRAVVVIDPGLIAALLDVPLWLIHDREAVQLRGYTGRTDQLAALAHALPAGRPLYLLRHGLLGPPVVPGLSFSPAGERTARLLLPGVEAPGHPGVAARSLLTVRAFHVEPAGDRRTTSRPR